MTQINDLSILLNGTHPVPVDSLEQDASEIKIRARAVKGSIYVKTQL